MDAILLERTTKIIIGLIVMIASIWGFRTILKTIEGGYGLYGAILTLIAGIFLILNQFFKF